MAISGTYIPKQYAFQQPQPRSNGSTIPLRFSVPLFFGSLIGVLYALPYTFRRLLAYSNRCRQEAENLGEKTELSKRTATVSEQSSNTDKWRKELANLKKEREALERQTSENLNLQTEQEEHALRNQFKEIIGYYPDDKAQDWWMLGKIEHEKEQRKKRKQAMISEIATEVSTKIATAAHITNFKLLKLYPNITLWSHEYLEKILYNSDENHIEKLRFDQYGLKGSLTNLIHAMVAPMHDFELNEDVNNIRNGFRLRLILMNELN